MTDDDLEADLDELYGVAPEAFTALRTQLVAAARKRGDADAARRIAAARRPTTAAWVVNVLMRSDESARGRLTELAERLRAAHASMDGSRIRELSTAQRTLVDSLVRAGFAAAGLPAPSGAVRDEVVGTLQAAIADPNVAARLGRLSKAERWAGFGEFGAVSEVPAGPSTPQTKSAPTEDDVAAAGERVVAARAAVVTAEREHAAAVEELSDRSSRLSTARRRYEKLLATLSAAERELGTADTEHTAAERSASGTAEQLESAKAELLRAESDMTATGGA